MPVLIELSVLDKGIPDPDGITSGGCKVVTSGSLWREAQQDLLIRTGRKVKEGTGIIWCPATQRLQCLEATYNPTDKNWSCARTGYTCGSGEPGSPPCLPVDRAQLYTYAEVTPGTPTRVRATAAGDPIWEPSAPAVTIQDVLSPGSQSAAGGLSPALKYGLLAAGIAAVWLMRRK